MQDPRLEMATNQARSENKRRQRQNIELLLLSIFTIAIDVVLIAIIVWLILKQGINSNTLAISSIIVAVIFGLSSLTFAYFQWRHPIHHEAQQHTYHPVLPPPTIPSNSPILPVSDANAQVTKFASFPSNGMILSKDALPPIWNVP